jgi:hypothetical protein
MIAFNASGGGGRRWLLADLVGPPHIVGGLSQR